MSIYKFIFDKKNIVIKMADAKLKDSVNDNHVISKVMDLTVVYYYELLCIDNIALTIPFTTDMLSASNLCREDLLKLAIENTVRKHPPIIKTFSETLKELFPEEPEKSGPEYKHEENVYLILNQVRTGASAMLHKETLDTLTELLDDDIVIIPSSVNEVLVLAKRNPYLPGWVCTVRDAHESLLECDERLSNSVYLYDKEKRTISYHSANVYSIDDVADV